MGQDRPKASGVASVDSTEPCGKGEKIISLVYSQYPSMKQCYRLAWSALVSALPRRDRPALSPRPAQRGRSDAVAAGRGISWRCLSTWRSSIAPLPGLRARPLPKGEVTCCISLVTQCLKAGRSPTREGRGEGLPGCERRQPSGQAHRSGDRRSAQVAGPPRAEPGLATSHCSRSDLAPRSLGK